MGVFRKIFPKKRSAFFWYVALTTIAFVLAWTIGNGNTIFSWVRTSMEINQQEIQIQQYKEEIEQLNTRINLLRNDKDTLEHFAREQFHFAEPTEDVYLIED